VGDQVDELRDRRVVEGKLARDKLEKNHSTAPYINFLVILLLAIYLGSIKMRSPGLRHEFLVFERFGYVKINHGDRVLAVLAHYEVVSLEVSVNNLFFIVQVSHRAKNLLHQVPNLLLAVH